MADKQQQQQKPAQSTLGPATGPCSVCGKAGAQACGQCRVDFYCGKEHQKKDWPRHKQQGCGSIALRVDETLGRHLVATKDIPAGTIIMRETPLVAFPKKTSTEVMALCVGCGEVLTLPLPLLARCAPCGWPVCGEACGRRAEHKPECAAFQRAGFKLGNVWEEANWDALAALRVSLAAREHPRLREMQSEPPPLQDALRGAGEFCSWVLRNTRRDFDKRRDAVVRWLTKRAGPGWPTADELRHAVGVVFLNSLTASMRPGQSVGALFAGQSLLEHACAPNASSHPWMVEENQQQRDRGDGGAAGLEHVLVASRDVRRGEHLSLTYCEVVFGAAANRRIRLGWWGFACRCALCADPTEGGLHLAAWYCGRCKAEGAQRLVQLVDDGDRWLCGRCGWSGSAFAEDADGGPRADNGRHLALRLRLRLETLKDKPVKVPLSDYERFLEEALWPRGPLHATHHAVLEAKKEMVMYDAEGEPTDVHSKAAVLAGYCRDLLAACAVLLPGINQVRGTVLTRLLLLHSQRLLLYERTLQASPRAWAMLQGEIKPLKEELEFVVPEIWACAVSPSEMMYCDLMTRDYQTLCCPASKR